MTSHSEYEQLAEQSYAHVPAEVKAAGADTFVAGSAIFGSDDYLRTIAEMRDRLNNADKIRCR